MPSPKNVNSSQPFVNALNAAFANGSLTFDLSQSANISTTGLVAPRRVSITLDATGKCPTTAIWFNDQLNPSGTTYLMQLFDSGGNFAASFGQVVLSGGSPLDLSTIVPSSIAGGVISFPGPVLLNPSGGALQTITGPLTVTGALIGNTVTATGVVSGANISWNTPMDFGAKGDVITLTDVAITTGTKIVTSASNPFLAGDVGKYMVIPGAGTSAARALVSPIASFQGAGQVTLTDNAGTTVSPATFPTLAYYGTNDRAALNSCMQTAFASGGNCYINDNKTFMQSGTGSTISFGALPGVKGGMLSGGGTIIYAPYGTLTSGVNDRSLYFQSVRNLPPCQIAAGAIAKGATSFTVSSSACVSSWKKGDTIILHEKDSGIGDVVYVDWALVSSISGTTVNLIAPLSVAFPNARAFNNSGSPASCFANSPCGLTVEKITNIIQDLSVLNIGLIVPNITDGSNTAAGIVTTATRRTNVHGITCQSAGQNCIATYLDNALTFSNNLVDCAIQNEFASNVGLNVSGNQFNTETIYGALFNYTIPSGGGMNIDLGTGFATASNNVFGSATSSVCFNAFYGVHDSVFANNACKFGSVAAPAVNTAGTYNNIFIANTLGGSVGGSTGMQLADTTTANVNINSDKNQLIGNKIDSTYTTQYVLSGANNTDTAVDMSSASSYILNLYRFGTNWTLGPSQATNFLTLDSSGRGSMLHNGITQMNITTGWGYCVGSGSAAAGGDTCLSRNAAGVYQFGTAPGNASGSFLTTSGTFSTSAVPSAAGGTGLGTAALPWNGFHLGTAATNNFTFTAAATAAARAVAVPDPGASTNLGLNYNATSGYYQSKRGTAGCTTAGGASAFTSPCTTTITFPASFPDTNFSVVCMGRSAFTGVPVLQGATATAANQATVQTQQATGVNASFATIDCIAVHD